MVKKQNYYYVLVMTDNGPVFVTSVDNSTKTARWDKTEAPLELGKYFAEDLTLGLGCNGYKAFTVSSKWEQDAQPYWYSRGQFVWKMEADNV